MCGGPGTHGIQGVVGVLKGGDGGPRLEDLVKLELGT